MDEKSVDLAKRKLEKNRRKRMRRKLSRALVKDKLENTYPTSKCLETYNDGKSGIDAETHTSLNTSTSSKTLSLEQSKEDTVSTKILTEKNVVDQTKDCTIPNLTLTETTAVSKTMQRNLRKRATSEGEVENVNQATNSLEISHSGKGCISEARDTVPAVDSSACSLPLGQLKKCTVSDEILPEKGITGQPKIVTDLAEISAEKCGSGRKKIKKGRSKSSDKVDYMDQSSVAAEVGTPHVVNSSVQSPSLEQLKLERVSTEKIVEKSAVEEPKIDTDPAEISVEKSGSGRKKRKKRRRSRSSDKVDCVDQTSMCLEISNQDKHCGAAEVGTLHNVNSTVQSLSQEQLKSEMVSTENILEKSGVEELKMNTDSAEVSVEKSESGRKKRKRGRRRRSRSSDKVDCVDQTSKCLELSNQDKHCDAAEAGTLHDVNSSVQSLTQEQLKLETVSTENIVEKSAVEPADIVLEKSATKEKKRRKSRKGNNEDQLKVVDPTSNSMEDCADNRTSSVTADLNTFPDINSTIQSLHLEQPDVNTVPACTAVGNGATTERKQKKKKKKMKPDVQNISVLPGQVVSSEKGSAMRTRSRRILLVLDINGLLADVVTPPPKEHKSDINILGRAIFKRPYYVDFLKFCFQNFDVGIWSSRSKKVIEVVVDYLLGGLKHKLLFCWDMCHTTQTGLKTLDNKYKPLVCKELRKLWEKTYTLPWKKGYYDESNTLLIDDSPYKALLNPMYTAIFPHPYTFNNQDDNALGPGGDLRVYLEGLARADNVKTYVQQHLFGQSPITEENANWNFYSTVLQKLPKQSSGKLCPQTPV